jgi:membrane protease YdiL (CAAX protease family)
LLHFPFTAEKIHAAQKIMAESPGFELSYGIMAVPFAPFAEEYLFRGLLYRALDREWGGWQAILGSAAFFAIYHPFLSWLPVGLLAVVSAVLFKKTGRLAPCVVLHLIYNLVVVWWKRCSNGDLSVDFLGK